MKTVIQFLIISFCLLCILGCETSTQITATPIQHTNSFYNVKHNDYPLLHLPLIDPIEAEREDGRTPWRVLLYNGPNIKVPGSKDNFIYGYAIEDLEKFAVKDGIIMAYSTYVDMDADPYIRDNYFHWFVVIPKERISEGFKTEDEFNNYIQSLGIIDPQWQKPDEAYELFERTNCLKWIPDCP
jgi:hypothetical protein